MSTFMLSYRQRGPAFNGDTSGFRSDRLILADKYKVQDGIVLFIRDSSIVHAIATDEVNEIITQEAKSK